MSDTFVKHDVGLGEYNMHNYVLNVLAKSGIYLNVPRIISYDRGSGTMTMERIRGMSVADFYGEDISSVPEHVLQQIRYIICKLWNNNIIYPDITGYNFIQDEDEDIWLIDFEHSYFFYDEFGLDPFVREFIGGLNSWNPDFA